MRRFVAALRFLEAPQDNLLIIGASCRAAAQSAKAAGFKTLSAIDFFADRDLTSIARVEPIEEFSAAVDAARRLPASPWMYVGGMENHPEVVSSIAAERPLWGNSVETVRRVRDPELFAAECAAVKMPCPKMRRELSAAEDPRGWLRKKFHSCGGLAVEVAESREPRDGWYFQEFVEAEHASAAFVSAGGKAVLLGVSQQLNGAKFHAPRSFQYAGSSLPFRLTPNEFDALRKLGNRLTRTFGLVGLWGLDFLEDYPKIWPLEVNPRYCSSFELLEWRDGTPMIERHINACRDGVLPDKRLPVRSIDSYGKLVVFAERECEVTEAVSKLLERWSRAKSREIGDLPAPGERFQPGDPIATVFAVKEIEWNCWKALHRRRRRLLDEFNL